MFRLLPILRNLRRSTINRQIVRLSTSTNYLPHNTTRSITTNPTIKNNCVRMLSTTQHEKKNTNKDTIKEVCGVIFIISSVISLLILYIYICWKLFCYGTNNDNKLALMTSWIMIIIIALCLVV